MHARHFDHREPWGPHSLGKSRVFVDLAPRSLSMDAGKPWVYWVKGTFLKGFNMVGAYFLARNAFLPEELIFLA